MKTFVINLDRDVERLAKVKSSLNAFGLPFERVSAVYGKDLTDDDVRCQFASFHAKMARWRPYNRGEIGCCLSHMAVWKRMVCENIDRALILEDDVSFLPEFKTALAFVETHLNSARSQVALLFDHTCGGEISDTPSNVGEQFFHMQRIDSEMCAEAYVLTLPAAKALLKANCPMVTACDAWTRWAGRGIIELYHVAPATAWQNRDDFSSNLKDGYQKPKGVGLCVYYLMRFVGKIVDWLYFKVLGR